MKKSIKIAGVLLLLAASTAQAKISFTYLLNDALGSPVVATDKNGAGSPGAQAKSQSDPICSYRP